ncbi:hypothetical protein SUDANB121_05308 [Nocardiopsis dassonvillei]
MPDALTRPTAPAPRRVRATALPAATRTASPSGGRSARGRPPATAGAGPLHGTAADRWDRRAPAP